MGPIILILVFTLLPYALEQYYNHPRHSESAE